MTADGAGTGDSIGSDIKLIEKATKDTLERINKFVDVKRERVVARGRRSTGSWSSVRQAFEELGRNAEAQYERGGGGCVGGDDRGDGAPGADGGRDRGVVAGTLRSRARLCLSSVERAELERQSRRCAMVVLLSPTLHSNSTQRHIFHDSRLRYLRDRGG